MANRISTIFDFSQSDGLKKIKKDVAEADGGVDKLKASWAGASGMMKGAAIGGLAAATTAVAAFGAKAVKEFTDSALAADRFANSTGMSVENASRWLGVMGQWGVEIGDLQDVFNNVASKIEASDPIFGKLGITIAKAADGTTDLDGTMKNIVTTLAGVEDPAKRAAAAASFFGEEGARQFAELVSQGKDVEQIFATLSSAKVIDEAEVKKAREYREAMKKLNENLTELTQTVGEGLVPAVSDAAEQLTMLIDVAQDLKLIDLASTLQEWDFITLAGQAKQLAKAIRGEVVFSLKDFKGSAEELRSKLETLGVAEQDITTFLAAYAVQQAEANEATGEAIDATAELGNKAIDTSSSMLTLADALSGVATESALVGTELQGTASDLRNEADAAEAAWKGIRDLRNQFSLLSDVLSNEAAALDLEDSFASAQEAMEDAYIAQQEGSEDASAAVNDHKQTVNALKEEIRAYAEQIGTIPPETVAEIWTMLDADKLAEAQALIAELTKTKSMYINPVVLGGGRGVGNRVDPSRGTNNMIVGATGGVVNRPTMALIGEAGPEAVIPLNKSAGNGPLPGGLGGATYNLNITVPAGSDGATIGRQVIDVIKQYERANGRGWRS